MIGLPFHWRTTLQRHNDSIGDQNLTKSNAHGYLLSDDNEKSLEIQGANFQSFQSFEDEIRPDFIRGEEEKASIGFSEGIPFFRVDDIPASKTILTGMN